MEKIITLRCKALSHLQIQLYRLRVEADGTVAVWDRDDPRRGD